HQRAPQWHTADKALRTVDGVDDPATGGVGADGTELLAENAVGGEPPLDPFARATLSSSVGGRHRGPVGLVLDSEGRAPGVIEVAQRDRPGEAGDLHDRLEQRSPVAWSVRRVWRVARHSSNSAAASRGS